MRETEKEYIVTAEIPGAKKEDVAVEVSGNVLTISGKVADEKKKEGEKHHFYERAFGTFSRSFTLPQDANPEEIKAEHSNGVLHLEIAKLQKQLPRKISIKHH